MYRMRQSGRQGGCWGYGEESRKENSAPRSDTREALSAMLPDDVRQPTDPGLSG